MNHSSHVTFKTSSDSPCLPFLVQDAPSPSWKQFQTGPTELCQKASWTVPGGVLSYDTLRGGVGRTDLILFQSGKHRSPLTGSTAPSEAAVPKTALVFSAGRGAGGRWSPAQAWKSLSPDLPKSETHGALMAVYAIIRKADLEAGGLWNWEMQPLSP